MPRIIRVLFLVVFVFFVISLSTTYAASRIENFWARPPIHVYKSARTIPSGLTPTQIKNIYNLPENGGRGTIAIIAAYDNPTIEKDLNIFSKQFGIAACTTANSCFEKHKMDSNIAKNNGWALETSLDVEWSHAIAPQAKILLVEAKSSSGLHLLQAVDYARERKDVVAISMSWGGREFPTEVELDNHFTSNYGITFFASSGDNGAGVSWPAASANVVGVGGTTLNFKTDGNFSSEKAWTGSGGGVSKYETQPSYQTSYDIPKAYGKRAVPDVSYDADPASGFPVYKTVSSRTQNGWYTVGGTSAGPPQWAAIKALGLSASNEKFYADKASSSHAQFFRDIVSGANGTCTYYCESRKRYDYVTGLGSPLTVKF
ncbi:S53 family peptidase [Candidatus Gottesmanbacteria bacterium]|nr:S53 family peptidase [Candidatus Gottesmanbacteria bacterium]